MKIYLQETGQIKREDNLCKISVSIDGFSSTGCLGIKSCFGHPNVVNVL